jgi:hypothetical protein
MALSFEIDFALRAGFSGLVSRRRVVEIRYVSHMVGSEPACPCSSAIVRSCPFCSADGGQNPFDAITMPCWSADRQCPKISVLHADKLMRRVDRGNAQRLFRMLVL